MLALDASFVLTGPKGERVVKADGFFVGLYATQLAARRDPDADPHPDSRRRHRLVVHQAQAQDRRLRHRRGRGAAADEGRHGRAARDRAHQRRRRRRCKARAAEDCAGRQGARRRQRSTEAARLAMSHLRPDARPARRRRLQDRDGRRDDAPRAADRARRAPSLSTKGAHHGEHAHGVVQAQRQGRRRDGRAARAADPHAARAARAHRPAHRLRDLALRRLHGRRRRHVGQVLHRADRAVRRRRRAHRRRPGAGRRAACAAAGLPRGARPAVRLLHARHAHARLPAAARRTRIRASRRSATGWPATCAAAPATRTS